MLTTKQRVLVVDDHEFLADGLRSRISLEPDLEFAGWSDSAELLWQKAAEHRADIALIDIELPGPDPFEAVRELRRRRSRARALILSAYVRDRYLQAALDAGASGYLSKADPPETVIDAIRAAARGKFATSPEVRERIGSLRRDKGEGPAARIEALTRREKEILRRIGRGLTREQIARTLHRSPKTVDAHRTSIMEKLDKHDRVELVRYAIREGLVEP